jgi:hypothetical protein
MKLDAWMRQDHPLAERLRLVERLSQALNAVHDRGEVLVALDTVLPDLGRLTKAGLERAMQGHVLAKTELVGTYQKRR